jgi:hypothetical protein
MPLDLSFISTLLSLFRIAPKAKEWIDVGLSVVDELNKEDPKLIPVLEGIGVKLFPNMADTIHKGANAVTAAVDVLYDPNGVKWLQSSLNKLGAKLDVDGGYGPLTKAAVEAFQKAHQPASGPVDGWAGKLTKAAIAAELAKLAK